MELLRCARLYKPGDPLPPLYRRPVGPAPARDRVTEPAPAPETVEDFLAVLDPKPPKRKRAPRPVDVVEERAPKQPRPTEPEE